MVNLSTVNKISGKKTTPALVNGKHIKVSILVCVDGKEDGYGLAEKTKNGYGPDKDIPMTPVYSGHEVLSYHKDDFDVMRLQKYYFDADLMNVVSNMLFKKRIERLQDIMFEANPYCIEAEEVVDEEDDDDCKDTPGKDLKKIQLIKNGSTP